MDCGGVQEQVWLGVWVDRLGLWQNRAWVCLVEIVLFINQVMTTLSLQKWLMQIAMAILLGLTLVRIFILIIFFPLPWNQKQLLVYYQLQSIISQTRMIQHIKKLFLAMIALTCFTCFQRADYNLPLFAFTFFLWEYKHPNLQKIRLFYLFVATWLVDFIWLVYWGVTWSSSEYQNNGSSGTSSFVLTLSVIAFILKLVIIIILYLFDQDCKTTLKNIVPNLKSIFSNNPDKGQAEE